MSNEERLNQIKTLALAANMVAREKDIKAIVAITETLYYLANSSDAFLENNKLHIEKDLDLARKIVNA